MTPANYNITIYEGSDFNLSLEWKYDDDSPIDLTGFSARMHIRNKLDSATFKDITPYITIPTSTDGRIDVSLPAASTIDWGYTTGVYDLEIEHTDGRTYRLLFGNVEISEEVTR